jgi:large subunit ribosomal protein L3
MCIGILGTKIGMTQIFDTNGLAIPITVIKAGPCVVTQIKDSLSDNYSSIQVGFLEKKKLKKVKKTEEGYFCKIGLEPFNFLKEFRLNDNDLENYNLGQILTVDLFQIGQLVNVTGKSIGKGFSGLQKRHNFARGPMTHGSKNHRAPGSIGAGTTPGRVFPGKKMSGQHGNKNITIKNLEILGIDNKENLLLLKGNIPGKSGNLISVYLSSNQKFFKN